MKQPFRTVVETFRGWQFRDRPWTTLASLCHTAMFGAYSSHSDVTGCMSFGWQRRRRHSQ